MNNLLQRYYDRQIEPVNNTNPRNFHRNIPIFVTDPSRIPLSANQPDFSISRYGMTLFTVDTHRIGYCLLLSIMDALNRLYCPFTGKAFYYKLCQSYSHCGQISPSLPPTIISYYKNTNIFDPGLSVTDNTNRIFDRIYKTHCENSRARGLVKPNVQLFFGNFKVNYITSVYKNFLLDQPAAGYGDDSDKVIFIATKHTLESSISSNVLKKYLTNEIFGDETRFLFEGQDSYRGLTYNSYNAQNRSSYEKPYIEAIGYNPQFKEESSRFAIQFNNDFTMEIKHADIGLVEKAAMNARPDTMNTNKEKVRINPFWLYQSPTKTHYASPKRKPINENRTPLSNDYLLGLVDHPTKKAASN